METQDDPDHASAARAILELLDRRAPGKTICPSEAARALAGEDFRPLMPLVREAAQTLVDAGTVEVVQGGNPIVLKEARGPIRLRLRDQDI